MAEGLTSISVPSGPGAPPFAFEDLFAPADNGFIHDPSIVASLFKDAAGADPVTTDGDLVYRIDDLSGNGNHSLQPNVSKRYVYRTAGGIHWLEGDGVDDYSSTPFVAAGDGISMFMCVSSESTVPLQSEYGAFLYSSGTQITLYSEQTESGAGARFSWNDATSYYVGISSNDGIGGDLGAVTTIAGIIEDGAQALKTSNLGWEYGAYSVESLAITEVQIGDNLPGKFFGALAIDRAVSIIEAGDTIALFQSKAT